MDPASMSLLAVVVATLPATIAAISGIVTTVLLHVRATRKLDQIANAGNGTVASLHDRIENIEGLLHQLLEQRGRDHAPLQTRSPDP